MMADDVPRFLQLQVTTAYQYLQAALLTDRPVMMSPGFLCAEIHCKVHIAAACIRASMRCCVNRHVQQLAGKVAVQA